VAALALKDSGRLAGRHSMGDGDFLMGADRCSGSAAHYGIPCSYPSFANNRFVLSTTSLHQERVAKERSRPVENRWIGQRISGPDIDIADDGARRKARKASARSRRRLS